MECNCNNNNSNGGVIPWVRGNRLPLIICVYENVVTQEQVGDSTLTVNEMTRVPYTIQDNDTVTVIMKSGFRQVEMPFTTDGNKVMVTDNGELPTGAYTVEVTIERGDGARGRWQETRQVRIYENTSDAQLGEMYSIDADLFFYAKGDTGTGIADITNNPDGTLTITMTDGTSYVTEALKGDKGDKGDTGERGVSIVAFDVTGQTDVSVIYTVTFSDDTTQDISVPKGPQGDTGLTGNGISTTTLNSDYTLTIAYTDGTTYTTPSIRGPQGAQGVSVIGFTQTGETATNTMYNLVFSDGRTQSVAIPKGVKGDKGDTGNPGPQGAQGPKGDTVTATDYTLYNVQGSDSQGAMSQDATTKAISAQTGYYTCGTAAGTPEKVVTVESGNLYKRTLGGHFKVQMTNKNTAASGVTLQIGSETAAALWYNGAAVSASNTWDADEVISVYYDGSVYQASNAQGGGGKAEKIKYDKTQSGLAAENVQEGLDKLNNRFKVYENDSSHNVENKYLSDAGTSASIGQGWMITEGMTLRDKKGTFIHFYAEHKIAHDMLNYGLYTGTSLTTYISGSGYQILSADDAGWKTVSVDDLLEAYPNAVYIKFTQTAIRLYPIYFSKSMKSVQDDIGNINTDIDSLEGIVTIKDSAGSADTTINGFSIQQNTSAYAKSAVWDVLVFNVQEQYKSIEIQSNTSGSLIAFMNSYNIPEETGDTVGVYATGYTATILQTASTTETYDIPDDCNYILFAKRTSSDTYYPRSIKFCYDVQTAIKEIDTEIGGTYIDETMLEPGTTNNDTGAPVADSNNNCYRTGYLPVGDATEVIIYNDRVLNGRYISYKFSWYNANKEYKGYTRWTRVTTAQIPVNALGGYVILVLSRNQNTTSTANDYAKYQLYLNIYGNDSLKKRVENIEDADYGSHISETDDILKGLAPRTLTLCTWNIGHFANGQSSSSDIDSSNYDQELDLFRRLIYNDINPRVIALNEYSAVFGKKPNNVNHNAKDVLFNDFGVSYEGSQNNFSCNTLFGNTYLTNIQMCAYECLKDEEITHTTAIKATDYYYIIADLYMEGRLVKLVSTHLAFDTSEGRGGVLQSLQFDELISVLSGYDRAIIAGDMNLSADNPRYDVFANAGYTLGNDGSITTHPGTSPSIDNIIYKGVVVSGIEAITTSLSDHYPLVATITV